VPLLGDIPLVGALFRSTQETRIKRNLMVFLRPTVIRDRAGIAALSGRKYNDIYVIGASSGSPTILPATPEQLFDSQGDPAPAIDLRTSKPPQSRIAPVPAPSRSSEVALRETAAPSRSGWAVQLSSLKNEASAAAMRDELISKGYDAFVRPTQALNQVFVGPVADRQQANLLRDQLSKQQRLDGFVVLSSD